LTSMMKASSVSMSGLAARNACHSLTVPALTEVC
jgi:hypothetical protein